MRNFAELYSSLNDIAKTDEKINLLVEYLKSSNPDDSIWAIYFLIGRKPKQIIPLRKLKQWSLELAKIPDWLFDESYKAVGDLIKTITLLLPKSTNSTDKSLHYWIEEKLLLLNNIEENLKKEEMISAWNEMNKKERAVWNKLVTGSFRVGVSLKLVVKALSVFSGVDEPVLSYRLIGRWKPNVDFFKQLVSIDSKDVGSCKPYPFYFAYQIMGDVEDLGELKNWRAEWKWDGIRVQLIKRQGIFLIWSHREGILNEKFPEFENFISFLPEGIVIEGAIIAWQNKKPLPFGELQRRIDRKNITKKTTSTIPAVFMAYDLLELNSKDIRNKPLYERSKKLFEIINNISDRRLLFSYKINANTWAELKEKRNESRDRFVDGLMLKRINSPYPEERKKGDWWECKIDPLTIDAVLIYAQRGDTQRTSMYTDYTFGVWDGNRLVTIAKANSGLTDEEIYKIDLFIKENTIEKFGPVCTVKPELVFELSFEGIKKSTRHKYGVVVRFPKIKKWQHDKIIKDASNLDAVKSLIY